MTWALETDRTDLLATTLVETADLEAGDGEAVLRVDRVGVTANNVTYGVLGEAFRYWEFFPASDPSRGRVPLWGFAEVAQSRCEGVEVGQRLYGYLPPASGLLVRPGRVDARGFRDDSEHRASLPSPYNAYALTTGDAAYEADREDLQVLYRPLFFTSFLLADSLLDGGLAGAQRVLISSASSKTAYGTAVALRDLGSVGIELVGLTSPGHRAFTEQLGCYDEVVTYDEVQQLDVAVPTGYADVAGSTSLRQALHAHLSGALVLDLVVGITHQDGTPAGRLEGARPTAFFAPDRMTARSADWGREGLDQRFGEAWRRFAPFAEQHVDVAVSHGADELQRVWTEVAGGTSDPRTGHVVQL